MLAPTRQIRQMYVQSPNRSAARALALAASSSRFLGGALVSSECRNRAETPATSSTAARNTASLAFDGLVNPLIFLTNCNDAARISSSVTGGSKLKSVLMFRHMGRPENSLSRRLPCRAARDRGFVVRIVSPTRQLSHWLRQPARHGTFSPP